jgi:hypothetical protein
MIFQFSANMKKDRFDFVGDFVYDEPRRDEKSSTLAHIIEKCLRRYQDNRGTPKRLILFRNGMSEGQYQTCLQYEIPFIRFALRVCDASECKVTVIVTQKVGEIVREY